MLEIIRTTNWKIYKLLVSSWLECSSQSSSSVVVFGYVHIWAAQLNCIVYSLCLLQCQSRYWRRRANQKRDGQDGHRKLWDLIFWQILRLMNRECHRQSDTYLWREYRPLLGYHVQEVRVWQTRVHTRHVDELRWIWGVINARNLFQGVFYGCRSDIQLERGVNIKKLWDNVRHEGHTIEQPGTGNLQC